MRTAALCVMALGGVLGALQVVADAPSVEMQAAAQRIAVTTCAACHGPHGVSYSPKFPRLAAQRDSYLAAQMMNFKLHKRGDADAIGYMWGMAAPLDDGMIAALADYYSRQKPAAGFGADPGAAARGKVIYAQGLASAGVPACATCHGPDAAGIADFPRLAGQSPQYLLKQLQAFHSNMRDAAAMHSVTAGLGAADMADVAAFLSSLGP